jgi:hypothetical protein
MRASFCDVCIFNFTPREKRHQVVAGRSFFSLTERDGRQTARIVIVSLAEVRYHPAVIAAEMVGTEDRIVQEPKTHEQREDSVLPRNLDLMLFPRGGLLLPRSVATRVTSCRLGKYEVARWFKGGL